MTSSPTSTVSASAPMSATTPARSLPWPDGKLAGQRSCRKPCRIIASPGLMPAAFTSTRTWPAAGTGFRTSRTSSTSMPPYESNCTALTITANTARAGELFRPRHDPHTDFLCGQVVAEHPGQHGQFGIAVAGQKLLDAAPHFDVQLFVDVGDNLAVGRQAQRDLLAVAWYRAAFDESGLDQPLDMFRHRAFELTGARGQADDADRTLGDMREQMHAERG